MNSAIKFRENVTFVHLRRQTIPEVEVCSKMHTLEPRMLFSVEESYCFLYLFYKIQAGITGCLLHNPQRQIQYYSGTEVQ